MVRSCYYLVQPPSWKSTLSWLSTIAYSIYSQLPAKYGGRLSFPNLRTCHAVVTGTHLSWTKYWKCVKLKENSYEFLISIMFYLKCLWHQVDKSFFSCTVYPGNQHKLGVFQLYCDAMDFIWSLITYPELILTKAFLWFCCRVTFTIHLCVMDHWSLGIIPSPGIIYRCQGVGTVPSLNFLISDSWHIIADVK